MQESVQQSAERAIAIVGVGAVLPDAPDAPTFWENLVAGRYSIGEPPADRWDPAAYYDPDPRAPDKSYSKIGGWVRAWSWDPLRWRLPIPPTVSAQMDRGQKWAIAAAREALADYGWPKRPLDGERTAVVLGNAMAGDRHYMTALRIYFPEYADELAHAPHFGALPAEVRRAVLDELEAGVGRRFPEITEDTMPGELANVIAGRIANLFDFHGPNFVVDAACASAMAAIDAAVEGLEEGEYDAVLAGGVDANMSASTFVKFSKIGALSGTGTRPYADGADGFVMGEGAALFVLRRLADAERDGDRVYATIRGVGGASDGRGKGITAPNPVGQRLAIERAWRDAGLSPATATFVEGHGTSTRVGDVVETQSLAEVLTAAGAPPRSVPLGSVKSNVGHLKAAAGAAGLLKTALALHHKQLPPSIHCETPNPSIDFACGPLRVQTALEPWDEVRGGARRAGVSAFGFGGTNFHVVLEEYVPGRLRARDRSRAAVAEVPSSVTPATAGVQAGPATLKPPPRGALVIGGATDAEIAARLREVHRAATAGETPPLSPPAARDLAAPMRVAIDYADAPDLAAKATKALKALDAGAPAAWKALRAQGIFRGQGAPGKVAFLYTGQGSQYANMLASLRAAEPIVAATFDEADRVMTPILGRPLTSYIFIDKGDPAAVAKLEEDLKQTEITQPAVLATDEALARLLGAYGVVPDMVMGHSLGEYGALVAAGVLPFADALRAVSARGHAMRQVALDDNGLMAAVAAPMEVVERVLATVDGYVVPANINSRGQCVIGGSTDGVRAAVPAFQEAGVQVTPLPVSHAFHTRIVAPASEPLRRVLQTLAVHPPHLPVVANVSGTFYPAGPGVEAEIVDILARQVASPVRFVTGLETLYDAGARVFVEVGPKKALHGFVEDVLGDRGDAVALYTNHPKAGDVAAFNQALCGLYAAGLGLGAVAREETPAPAPAAVPEPVRVAPSVSVAPQDRLVEMGRLFAEFLERGRALYDGDGAPRDEEPVVVTGAALGLPGTPRVFDDENVARLLRGEQLIDVIPTRLREAMVDKHVTRLVKSDAGEPHFEVIDRQADVIKLAGRAGALDLAAEFGFPADRVDSLDRTTRLAIGAGLDALRDAGIPLAMRYKTTTRGTALRDRWMLPDALRDDTGVVFASAFPGFDAFADEQVRYHADHALRQRIADLRAVRARADAGSIVALELDRRIHDLETELARAPYSVDRTLLFRLLSMGHSQLAELIGARGPNTQVNAACASTTLAIALAEDWIRRGRCRRVVVVAADDVTSDRMLEWIGAGFLASGAAATDEVVADAALPFDRRRHGMVVGMGAAALVVESAAAARERGVRPIAEVLATVVANSAFHGTRLDVEHIAGVMERMVAGAERRWGLDRRAMAPRTVFVSHETYTPARGGSAQAEVTALRRVFGADADRVVVANTKGFTGHAMAAGVEDVLAVKSLETGLVPPVANHREVDPELAGLNLSQGGAYPVTYALRLGAGFGSQISMALLRWVPTPDGARPTPDALGFAGRIADRAAWGAWLSRVSGQPSPELEVVQRTLRVADRGAAPAVLPAAVPAELPTRAPSPAPSPAPPVAAGDPVRDRVLALVAEQTGYPVDMLDLELDLEADLGIDTVKQAEMFAAVRGEWGIARDETLKLRDFPTLRHIVQFVHAKRPDLAATVAPPPRIDAAAPAPAAPAPASADDAVRQRVLEIVAEQTGYPIDMLDLDLDLEADLGVDTVKQAEMFASVRRAWDIPRDETLRLRDFPTLAHVIGFVRDRRPDLAAPAAPPPATDEDPVLAKVLALAAEQTGYPVDMLDPTLDLEADLGVDTVKQAEMFVKVRQTWGIARDETLRLRDFPTLADVARFVRERAPELQAPAPETTPEPAATPEESALAGEPLPRRVPVAVVRPALAVCKPTGISLAHGTRVVVMCDAGGVGNALARRLENVGVHVLAIPAAPGGAPDGADLAASLAAFAAERPVAGVYWLPALDAEGPLADLDAWREALRVRVKLLHAAVRALPAKSAPFLVAATRMGGRHGYDAAGAASPLGGAVTGFAKALKRERPAAFVKAVDFEPGRDAGEVARLLVDETLRDPGAVEIGYLDDRRTGVALEERPTGGGGITLRPDSTFVVTGAAGSIVAAIVADLAATCGGGVFHLLDVAADPAEVGDDLARVAADREGLKRDLADRIRAAGARATPAAVERELAALERAACARAAIDAIARAGGRATYHRVDLRDGEAVARAIDTVRATAGRVDVLLHAAGIEVSRPIADKTPEEFARVLDVKADGWFNLLHAVGDMPLGAVVAFSSVAGRFGNAGQTDYSAANDLLCKLVSALRAERPDVRALAIDWTAWAEIGMASRGSIPKIMEAAGIDMLKPAEGIPIVGRELAEGDGGEVVVARRLGALAAEWDDTGGLDVDDVLAAPFGPMATRVVGFAGGAVTVEATLDPAAQPFLDDHRIDGTPVLPGVMGIEAFAEAACCALPGWRVAAVEDVRFLAPFKCYRDEPRTATVRAALRPDGDGVTAACAVTGERRTARGVEVTTHFTGTVRLVRAAPARLLAEPPTDAAAEVPTVEAADVYRVLFHGPAYQVVARAAAGAAGAAVGWLRVPLPPDHVPEEPECLTAPRLVELCFQTAGLHEIATTGRMGLPLHVARVSVLALPDPAAPGAPAAVVRPAGEGAYDAVVVDGAGRVCVQLQGYQTIALPGTVSDDGARPFRAALAAPQTEHQVANQGEMVASAH